ncbi:tegument protein VP13/14 [Ateline alphaherpesvirus 1]|uniref:Tegument protein UL47 n=1 Tax=Herpesvirus ateles type 1 (strain Lennette) TaxID=35243 RepID=A0A1S6JLL0_HSVA1|nr:tegument protein VP13/14 [Ateline alphaherpesvirus 1]AQS79169.1 tegument protein VP13/14 [Ateline alphaherpesvirus 1]
MPGSARRVRGTTRPQAGPRERGTRTGAGGGRRGEPEESSGGSDGEGGVPSRPTSVFRHGSDDADDREGPVGAGGRGERAEPCPLLSLELAREPAGAGPWRGPTLGLYDDVPGVRVGAPNGRASEAEVRRLLPAWRFRPMASPWLEAAAAPNAPGAPALLLAAPLWRSFAAAPAGSMFLASPPRASEAWRRSLLQGRGLAWAVTGASLHASLGQTRATTGQALAFLTDALLRVAANARHAGARVHAGARDAARTRYAAASLLRPPLGSTAPLLAGGPLPPQGGALASALRGSLGSLAHWADLRALLDGESRVAVRHACRASFAAEALVLCRASPAAPRLLLSREAAALGRAADALAALAERSAQWLGAAVAARTRPDSDRPARENAERPCLYGVLPLGSVGVANAEAEALGGDAARRLAASSALGTALAAAVCSLRGALGHVMLRFARISSGDEAPGAVRPGRARECDGRRGRDGDGEDGDGEDGDGEDGDGEDGDGEDGDGEDGDGEAVAATRALVAAALILQRLLGLLNVVAAGLALAAEEGSAAAAVGTHFPPRYACVMYIARPLYAPVPYGQFWADVRAAAADLRLRPVAGEPPPGHDAVVTLEALRGAIRGFPADRVRDPTLPSVLGRRVSVAAIATQFRRLVMGEAPARRADLASPPRANDAGAPPGGAAARLGAGRA